MGLNPIEALASRGYRWRSIKPLIGVIVALVISLPIGVLLWAIATLLPSSSLALHVLTRSIISVIIGSYVSYSLLFGKPFSPNILYGRVFFDLLLSKPQILSLLRPMGIDWFQSQLDDFSMRAVEWDWKNTAAELRNLRSFSTTKMTPQARLSQQVLEYYIETQANLSSGREFGLHHYLVNQMEGVHAAISEFLLNKHALTRPSHVTSFIKRCAHVRPTINEIMGQMTARTTAGIHPPKFVISRVISQIQAFLAPEIKKHPIYELLEAKITSAPLNFDTNKTARTLATLLKVLEKDVYPAYRDLLTYCEKLHSQLTTDHGVWALPNGDEYYRRCLVLHTSTNMTADEIHAIGLDQVRRLRGEIESILRSLNLFPEGSSLRVVIDELKKDPKYLYTTPDAKDHDAVRERILQDYRNIIEDIDSKMGPLFNLRAPEKVRVIAVPEFKQNGAPMAYYWPPALDGSAPGTFYANMRAPHEVVKFDMRTLAYHEAVPGHHFQLSIAQTLKGLPFFRRVVPFTAYCEGWALYTEQLAAEEGFQNDPLDKIGYLSAQLMRAVRLVVDTGIHQKKWSLARAIDYMIANTLLTESEAVTEVERYFVMPGQACAYMVGMQAILRLRQLAKDQLGAAFSLAEFHDVVLGSGSLPLVLLERVVNDWLATKAKK